MSFLSIPLRANGQKFYYTWFNLLRTAGIALENFLGPGYIIETNFALANNTASPTNVTGLLILSASYKSAHIYAEVRRKTDSVEVISSGRLIIQYRTLTSSWELLDELSGDDDGAVFTVTSGGQVQYTTDNQSGTNYTGTIKFKVITFSV